MNIAIDIREACNPKRAGKGGWTLEVTAQLLKSEHQLYLLTDTTDIPFKTENAKVITVAEKGIKWHIKAAKWLRKNNIDHFIAPTSYITPWLVAKYVPTTVIVHDMIAFQPDSHQFKAKWIERLLLPKVLKNVKNIATVSKTTADDLQVLFPNVNVPITPIYAGGPQDVVAL